MSQNPAEPPAPPAVDISSAEAMRDKVGRVARAIAKARECEPTEEQAASLPEPLPDPRDALIGTDVSDAAIAEEEAREIEPQNSGRFALGDFVSKKSGSKWRGCVVGTYATVLTDCGYVIKSWYEPNSVQNYPATALEPWTPPSADDCADATIARLSAELEAAREALAPFAKAADLYDAGSVFLGAGCSDYDFRRARAALAKLSKGA